ncbi:hypothetical protein [Bacterioplanoides sp.]|uniref:hypothetical protein n=1 Tax=Bacterioplanoides sp. TaxID=2066072 RepID=UPI003B58D26D
MYEQVEKPKDIKSRVVVNSVGQKKSIGKQGFGFVDNRPKTDCRDLKPLQRSVYNFKSTGTMIYSPLEQIKNLAQNTDYEENEDKQGLHEALTDALPKTPKSIPKVSFVEAEIEKKELKSLDRKEYKSKVVGRCGRQESLLTIGEEAYYQGGHLISHAFLDNQSDDKSSEEVDGYFNLVPMEASLNNLTYKKIETKLMDLSGKSRVKLSVETSPAIVCPKVLAGLTGCKLKNSSLPPYGLNSTIAREVKVSVNGGKPETATSLKNLLGPGDAGAIDSPILLYSYLGKIGKLDMISESMKIWLKQGWNSIPEAEGL